MNQPNTYAQRKVLTFIREFIERERFPPTLREIADGMGFASRNSAKEHIICLEKQGILERVSGRARGIRFPIETAAMAVTGTVA